MSIRRWFGRVAGLRGVGTWVAQPAEIADAKKLVPRGLRASSVATLVSTVRHKRICLIKSNKLYVSPQFSFIQFLALFCVVILKL